jgi:hypothetical protein
MDVGCPGVDPTPRLHTLDEVDRLRPSPPDDVRAG